MVSPRHAEAHTEGRGLGPAARGGPRMHRMRVDGAATKDTAIVIFNIVRLLIILYSSCNVSLRIVHISILAPFPGVAVHVEQAQVVRLQESRRVHALLRVGKVPPVGV